MDRTTPTSTEALLPHHHPQDQQQDASGRRANPVRSARAGAAYQESLLHAYETGHSTHAYGTAADHTPAPGVADRLDACTAAQGAPQGVRRYSLDTLDMRSSDLAAAVLKASFPSSRLPVLFATACLDPFLLDCADSLGRPPPWHLKLPCLDLVSALTQEIS